MTIRVSTNQLFDRSIANILSSQERLSEVQQNVATGRAILTPSDDPVGAAQVVRLTEEPVSYTHLTLPTIYSV